MRWAINEVDGVAVVQMLSNKVNKQNDEFFSDLQAAFDLLERELPGRPVVLTGQGGVFSAGLDFDYTFPIFARRDEAEIGAWFGRFGGAILRVFTYPCPTIAAVNGHAIAGGIILALACDHRIAAAGELRCGLNEVPVGIPMPSLYTELVRYRIGSPATSDAILTGKLYGVEEAHRLGFYQEVAPADELMARARQAGARGVLRGLRALEEDVAGADDAMAQRREPRAGSRDGAGDLRARGARGAGARAGALEGQVT
jgi:enoyl-CoA hydratase